MFTRTMTAEVDSALDVKYEWQESNEYLNSYIASAIAEYDGKLIKRSCLVQVHRDYGFVKVEYYYLLPDGNTKQTYSFNNYENHELQNIVSEIEGFLGNAVDSEIIMRMKKASNNDKADAFQNIIKSKANYSPKTDPKYMQ